MPTPKEERPQRPPLSRRQTKLSVIGRKSGRTTSIPVWFVLEGALSPASAGLETLFNGCAR